MFRRILLMSQSGASKVVGLILLMLGLAAQVANAGHEDQTTAFGQQPITTQANTCSSFALTASITPGEASVSSQSFEQLHCAEVMQKAAEAQGQDYLQDTVGPYCASFPDSILCAFDQPGGFFSSEQLQDIAIPQGPVDEFGNPLPQSAQPFQPIDVTLAAVDFGTEAITDETSALASFAGALGGFFVFAVGTMLIYGYLYWVFVGKGKESRPRGFTMSPRVGYYQQHRADRTAASQKANNDSYVSDPGRSMSDWSRTYDRNASGAAGRRERERWA